MTNNKAYKIGFEAAKSNGQCIAARNQEIMELVRGEKVGGGASEIFKSFNAGVSKGLGL